MATLGRSWAALHGEDGQRSLRITRLWSVSGAAAGSPTAAGGVITVQAPVVRSRRPRSTRGMAARLRQSGAELASRIVKAGRTTVPDVFDALIGVDRSAELPLFAGVAISLLLLSSLLVPDGAIMRLAQPRLSLSLPEVTAGDRPYVDVPAPAAESRARAVNSPVDVTQFERLQVREYRLTAGDTLSGIAARNQLRIDTLASFNRITDARRIRVGEVFQIPNRDGLLHSVGRGESLSSLASRYGTTVNALLDANDLNSSTITVGQTLFVPDARMNSTDLKRLLGQLFVQPASGRLSSGFGMRDDPFTGIRRFHNGIDLSGTVGASVRAAMAGRVVHVENQPGNYGRFVIIRHDGGYQTLYAHLDSYTVRTGQQVNQGQLIGRMGNTGRSTGPHLHFSVIKDGSFVDPMRYLR